MFIEEIMPENVGERHIPIVLLVDTSGSMAGEGITEMNEGLRLFGKCLNEDRFALGRAEIAIVSFSTGVQIETPFIPASSYEAPLLSAGGMTCLNEGIEVALDLIEERKVLYKSMGVSYYRPLLILISDGYATDSSKIDVKMRLKAYIQEQKVTFIPLAINGSDTNYLLDYYPDKYSNRYVLSVKDYDFKDAFIWLSQSASIIANTNPMITDQVTLPELPSGITAGI